MIQCREHYHNLISMDINNRLRTGAIGMGIIFMFVLAIGVYRYTDAYASSIQPGNFRSFSVSGEGKVVISPDVAKFSYSVITEGGNDLSSLMKLNEDKGGKAIAFLKAEGVKADDIKTQQFNVSPRYQYSNCSGLQGGQCPPPSIVGYTVSQTVSVKVRKDDFGAIGKLLSGVVGAGANSVSQISFDVDDRNKAESEARAAAFAEARDKAEALADAGGFRIGRLLDISEGGYGPYYAQSERSLSYGAGADSAYATAPASIEPGTQDIVINLALRYEIR